MLKIAIPIILFNLPVLTNAAFTVSAPAVVEQFYGTMMRMNDVHNDSNAYKFRERIKDCFRGKEDSGIPVSNDFVYWGYAGEKQTSNQYANIFYELAYQKKILRLESYSITSSEVISEVDLKRYRNQSDGLTQTVVKKTFSDGKTRKTFSDTLLVERNEIVVFRNTASYSIGEDIEALRAIAASYYTTKRYYSAYKTYEKILEIDPNNANAFYRLGIMHYYGKGCKYSKKRSLQYIERSLSLGFGEKASIAKYHITHNNNLI